MPDFMQELINQFQFVFLEDDRWMYLAEGLVTTLKITFFALILGITIGVTIATIRSTHDNTIDTLRPGLGKVVLKFLNVIAKVYLTVIRGTPIVVQLLIMYCIVFAASNNKVLIAIIAFGINSGAYVAEIVRSGIMSIDKGQMEAGRSLGYNYVQAMIFIIIPQAIKNILPALANEFITLLKETSVSGYIAIQDLTKGAYIIIGRTYTAFMPLITVALVYLTLVLFFTWLVGKMERRLRSSDH